MPLKVKSEKYLRANRFLKKKKKEKKKKEKKKDKRIKLHVHILSVRLQKLLHISLAQLISRPVVLEDSTNCKELNGIHMQNSRREVATGKSVIDVLLLKREVYKGCSRK